MVEKIVIFPSKVAILGLIHNFSTHPKTHIGGHVSHCKNKSLFTSAIGWLNLRKNDDFDDPSQTEGTPLDNRSTRARPCYSKQAWPMECLVSWLTKPAPFVPLGGKNKHPETAPKKCMWIYIYTYIYNIDIIYIYIFLYTMHIYIYFGGGLVVSFRGIPCFSKCSPQVFESTRRSSCGEPQRIAAAKVMLANWPSAMFLGMDWRWISGLPFGKQISKFNGILMGFNGFL